MVNNPGPTIVVDVDDGVPGSVDGVPGSDCPVTGKLPSTYADTDIIESGAILPTDATLPTKPPMIYHDGEIENVRPAGSITNERARSNTRNLVCSLMALAVGSFGPVAIFIHISLASCLAPRVPADACQISQATPVGVLYATNVTLSFLVLILNMLTPLEPVGERKGICTAPKWLLWIAPARSLQAVLGTIATPYLGFHLSIILRIFGSISVGVAIDTFGLGVAVPAKPPSLFRLIAVTLILVGVVASVYPFKVSVYNSTHPSVMLAYSVLAFAAGACLAVESALSAALVPFAGGPLHAAAAKVTVTAIFTSAVSLVCLAVIGDSTADISKSEWYVWMLPVSNMITEYMYSALPSFLGVGLFVSLVSAGSTGAGLVFDVIGAFGFNRREVTIMRVLGTALCILGVLVAQLGGCAFCVNISRRLPKKKPSPGQGLAAKDSLIEDGEFGDDCKVDLVADEVARVDMHDQVGRLDMKG